MLAQNFKTAKQLNITDQEYEALQKTLVWFETGKIVHVSNAWDRYYSTDYSDLSTPLKVPVQFNLSVWYANVDHKCNTVACIGGTAEAIGNVRFDDYEQNRRLKSLFNPTIYNDFDSITVEQASQALRNLLTTGWPRWRQVLTK